MILGIAKVSFNQDGEPKRAVNVKLSMRPIDRGSLSEHEVKRCRATAKGQPWEVWEEDILWWSPDRQHWQPLEDDVLPGRRRWLLVEREEGLAAALIWDAGDEFKLPSADSDMKSTPERRLV